MVDTFPPTTPSNHKKKFIRVVILALLVVFIILGIVNYRKETSVEKDPEASKQENLMKSSYNPPANLTEAEIKAKEDQMKLPNPPATLTPEEIEAKRAILEKN